MLRITLCKKSRKDKIPVDGTMTDTLLLHLWVYEVCLKVVLNRMLKIYIAQSEGEIGEEKSKEGCVLDYGCAVCTVPWCMHHVRQSLSPGQRMIVQIPSISPLVLQMLGFDVFIIHLSSLRREGTRSVPLNYQIFFLPVTMRREAHNMSNPEKRERWAAGL